MTFQTRTAGNLAVSFVWNQTIVPLTRKLAASRARLKWARGGAEQTSTFAVRLAAEN